MFKLFSLLSVCLLVSAGLYCSIENRVQKVHGKIDAYEKMVKTGDPSTMCNQMREGQEDCSGGGEGCNAGSCTTHGCDCS